jgi:Asp-tRNA(Asn)/Glu-tRNA(Gln) amidotransferase A subunit family amidase
VKNSDLTALIMEKNGIILGCTNVPEFAASARTCNPASGQTRNIYSHTLTVSDSLTLAVWAAAVPAAPADG